MPPVLQAFRHVVHTQHWEAISTAPVTPQDHGPPHDEPAQQVERTNVQTKDRGQGCTCTRLTPPHQSLRRTPTAEDARSHRTSEEEGLVRIRHNSSAPSPQLRVPALQSSVSLSPTGCPSHARDTQNPTREQYLNNRPSSSNRYTVHSRCKTGG